MREGELTLIKRKHEKDKYGVLQSIESKRVVFADIESITQSEFFAAGKIGIRAQYKATMFFYDYEKEDTVELEGQELKVYRTYQKSKDRIELYLSETAGQKNE